MTAKANTERRDPAVPAIELKGISKSFGPVQANKDISIRVMPGETWSQTSRFHIRSVTG